MNQEPLRLSLQQAREGLSLFELLQAHPDLPRRTVQRWLAQQVQAGQLLATGQARARRYFVAQSAPVLVEKTGHSFPPFIALSADSRDVLTYVEQPTAARHPVGYQIDFLASYQPNQTFYLSANLRHQLQRMGCTAPSKHAAGTHSRAILGRLLIDLSWASSHLEGNTYSRLDTRVLIENGQVAQGKAAIETQMILNHKAAIEMLVGNAQQVDFNRFTLLNLHSTLSEGLLPNPLDEGRIRQHVVDISHSVYRPLSVPSQLDEAFMQMLNKAAQIADPFEQSFFIMVHLPYLQPFADVNKRVSRLACNIPLIKANLCPLTFLDVPEAAYSRAVLGVYELTRVELLRDVFLWAYERSTQEYLAISQQLTEPDPRRILWREVIKAVVHEVVMQPGVPALAAIELALEQRVLEHDQAELRALVLEEMRRLHEGVLARYGLRLSEFLAWQLGQSGVGE
jgi:hypothetical protein